MRLRITSSNSLIPRDETDYYVANADEVTAKGIEIEGFIKPDESLTLSVAYGLV